MERLETERLILRPWETTDAPDMFAYARDPRVGPLAGWPPHKDLAESARITAIFAESDEVLAITLKESGRVIGSLGLHRRNSAEQGREALWEQGKAPDEGAPEQADACGDDRENTRELGYILHPAYWGRGLVPEAARAVIAWGFETLGLCAIWGGYFDGNGKSRRVIEKCGFTYVETREVPVPQMGGYRVEHFYKLDRAQWEERRIHCAPKDCPCVQSPDSPCESAE